MLDPDAENHVPASLTIPEISVRHEGVPLRGVDDHGELVEGEVPGTGMYAGDIGPGFDLQPPDVAEIPRLHHGQDGALEDDQSAKFRLDNRQDAMADDDMPSQPDFLLPQATQHWEC